MKQTIELFERAIAENGRLEERDLAILFLVPLVETAWIHGAVSGCEKRVIFECAREDGIDERHWFNTKLDEWLTYRPSSQFFDQCVEMIGAALDEMVVAERTRRKTGLLARCREVARAAGSSDPMDVEFGISPEERELLNRYELVLG